MSAQPLVDPFGDELPGALVSAEPPDELLECEPWPPRGAVLLCAFSVIGRPRPAGSKSAHVIRNKQGRVVMKDGQPVVVTRDSSGAEGEAWREQVARRGITVHSGPLLSGPLAVEMTFVRQRGAGHFGTGRNAGMLKGSAPSHPVTRPDALKLARAVEDSLSSVVYSDDSVIVEERLRKVFGTPERVEVRIWRLGPVEMAPEQESLLD